MTNTLFNKIISSVTLVAVLLVSLVIFLANSSNVGATTGKLTLTNTVDKAVADRGDSLNYTLVIKNTGTVPTENTFLWINEPNLADYVAGSSTYIFQPTPNITRNLTDAWINDGVNFGTLSPNETVTLKYQTKVAANANPDDILWSVSSVTSNQTERVQANSFTKVFFKNSALCAEKTADKTTVSVGDTVTFTIKVCNQSNVNLTDILIEDPVKSPFKYVAGSTTLEINGKVLNVADSWQQTTVNIGNLPPGHSATLKFKVTVTDALKDGEVLKNQATISAKETAPGGIVCEVILKGKVLGIVDKPEQPKPSQPKLPETGAEGLLMLAGLVPVGYFLKKFKSKI